MSIHLKRSLALISTAFIVALPTLSNAGTYTGGGGSAGGTSYDDSSSGNGATTVQGALDYNSSTKQDIADSVDVLLSADECSGCNWPGDSDDDGTFDDSVACSTVGDLFFDAETEYHTCTTAGSSGVAVWAPLSEVSLRVVVMRGDSEFNLSAFSNAACVNANWFGSDGGVSCLVSSSFGAGSFTVPDGAYLTRAIITAVRDFAGTRSCALALSGDEGSTQFTGTGYMPGSNDASADLSGAISTLYIEQVTPNTVLQLQAMDGIYSPDGSVPECDGFVGSLTVDLRGVLKE